ncbi:MAG TPA: DciA family protein [Vicinamibacterales bacterium]|nr:DciA family protein [Vicinamibacterales bacterium]
MVPIQDFSTGVLGEILRRQPASKARTAFAWQLAVGPRLARMTTVELDAGVLTVRAADPRWLDEVRRAPNLILPRLQRLLGADAVTRIDTRSACIP